MSDFDETSGLIVNSLQAAWMNYMKACEDFTASRVDQGEINLRGASCSALIAIAEELRALNHTLKNRGI